MQENRPAPWIHVDPFRQGLRSSHSVLTAICKAEENTLDKGKDKEQYTRYRRTL